MVCGSLLGVERCGIRLNLLPYMHQIQNKPKIILPHSANPDNKLADSASGILPPALVEIVRTVKTARRWCVDFA